MRQGRGRKGGEKSQNREYMQPHTYDQQNLPLQGLEQKWSIICHVHHTCEKTILLVHSNRVVHIIGFMHTLPELASAAECEG